MTIKEWRKLKIGERIKLISELDDKFSNIKIGFTFKIKSLGSNSLGGKLVSKDKYSGWGFTEGNAKNFIKL
jgi:hypothetical protein